VEELGFVKTAHPIYCQPLIQGAWRLKYLIPDVFENKKGFLA
jgi:hypothetical protein